MANVTQGSDGMDIQNSAQKLLQIAGLLVATVFCCSVFAQTNDLSDLEQRLQKAKAVEAQKQKDKQAADQSAKKAAAAKRDAEFTPGRSYHSALSSGGQGPEMVIVPAGKFLMGSPSYEGDRRDDEGPQHEVSVKRLAIGKYPVTKAEFAAFVNATGYRTDAEKNTQVNGNAAVGCLAYKGGIELGWKEGSSWRDPGFPQDDNHPVTCLSWNDAQAYVEWLRVSTGKPYRLPSEAESEYTTRAGSTDRYPWGDDSEQACRYANVGDASLKSRIPEWKFPTVICDDGYVFTSPVGHFQANAFGVYDAIGNVWKWVQDCGADSYSGALANDDAQQSNGCDKRVLRGASLASGPSGLTSGLRSAFRLRQPAAFRFYISGLRVAQDL